MAADDVGRAVVYMASLPLDTNVLFMTVMANLMPFVGQRLIVPADADATGTNSTHSSAPRRRRWWRCCSSRCRLRPMC